jgi:hypothetical protein
MRQQQMRQQQMEQQQPLHQQMAQQAYGLPQQYSAYQMQNPYGPAAAQTMQRSDQADMQRN